MRYEHERRKVTDEQLRRDVAAGLTVTQIARKHAVWHSAVHARLARLGLSATHGRRRFTEGELRADLRRGLMPAQIAEKYGVTTDAIYKRLKRRGIEPDEERAAAVVEQPLMALDSLVRAFVVERQPEDRISTEACRPVGEVQQLLAEHVRQYLTVSEMFDEGWSAQEISEESSVPLARVQAMLWATGRKEALRGSQGEHTPTAPASAG